MTRIDDIKQAVITLLGDIGEDDMSFPLHDTAEGARDDYYRTGVWSRENDFWKALKELPVALDISRNIMMKVDAAYDVLNKVSKKIGSGSEEVDAPMLFAPFMFPWEEEVEY